MSNINFDYSAYNGEQENECTLLTRSIINARRRIEKNLDCNNYSLASRTSLLEAVAHLNLLLVSIFDTYEEFVKKSE
jgi:hypothetical protein